MRKCGEIIACFPQSERKSVFGFVLARGQCDDNGGGVVERNEQETQPRAVVVLAECYTHFKHNQAYYRYVYEV